MKKLIYLTVLILGFSSAQAQDSDVEELNLIEMELDRNASPQTSVSEEAETIPSETAKSTAPANKTEKIVNTV